MRARIRFLTGRLWPLIGAALALAAPASALEVPAEAPAVWTHTIAATGASVLLLPTPWALASAPALTPLPQQGRARPSNVALMVVGGAGLVVGSIIGGDTGTIVMVAGGAVGLLGLYRFLQ